MNKEEIINILTINLCMTDYIDVTKYLSDLEEENKSLKEVIDKAIEYVNNHIHQEIFTGYMDSYELKKLLEILKGSGINETNRTS